MNSIPSTPRYRLKQYRHKGIINPQAYAREVQLRCYEPTPVAAPFVELYFVARWNRPGKQAYQAIDILTKPVVNLFFTADKAFINGVNSGTRGLSIHQSGVYAGVKFRPGGFRPFYRQPLISLTGQSIPARQVFPAATSGFTSALLALQDDQEIAAWLEELLIGQQPQADAKIDLISDIIMAIEQDQAATVSSLATDFRLSERTLQHIFKEYVGVGAKWALMRHRLLQSIQNTSFEQKPSWTAVAAELNYSTQSHFSNDFKRCLGISPSEYLKLISGTLRNSLPASQLDILTARPL